MCVRVADEAGIAGPLVSMLITNYLNVLDQVRTRPHRPCPLACEQTGCCAAPVSPEWVDSKGLLDAQSRNSHRMRERCLLSCRSARWRQ